MPGACCLETLGRLLGDACESLGAPSWRDAIHPPATLESEHPWRQLQLLWLDLIGAIPLALAMVQEAAPSTQQAPHPITARAAHTCCRLTAVGPLHAAGSLQAPLLIDLAMVAKQHCAAEGPGRVGARPDEVLLTAVLRGASERRARAPGGD